MVQLIDKTLQHKHPLQNISAIDRTSRIIIGMALIGVWFVVDFNSINIWLALLPLIGIIPLLSGIIGWCPVHAMFNTRSCGTDSHNECGTFPYQVSRLFHK